MTGLLPEQFATLLSIRELCIGSGIDTDGVVCGGGGGGGGGADALKVNVTTVLVSSFTPSVALVAFMRQVPLEPAETLVGVVVSLSMQPVAVLAGSIE